ncbi:MAG: bifunctional chorismate mutase/prephenate dehydratase [Lachnospiraceae bacterium]|nr:bifunctional chorismate mutase/prephenate dehydratase [Lachnospiraceae bacterium]
MKVSYSGIEGSFASIAASLICPGAERISYRTFPEAYAAVENDICELAILPIENSYAGEVAQVTDLMFHGDLCVTGVYELPVVHCLMGIEGSSVEDVKTVISHPQALEQCGNYILEHGFITQPCENTARAAKETAERNDPSVAAIASGMTAKLYDLSVLEDQINDSPDNTTRFAVLKKADHVLSEQGDSCYNVEDNVNSILMFTVEHASGTLARALSVLSDFGYNMRLIRSRPLKNKNWDYYFYTEVEGSLFTEKARQMLSGLKYECGELKVLGTYRPGEQLSPD